MQSQGCMNRTLEDNLMLHEIDKEDLTETTENQIFNLTISVSRSPKLTQQMLVQFLTFKVMTPKFKPITSLVTSKCVIFDARVTDKIFYSNTICISRI